MGAGDFGLAESSVIHFLLCEGLEICERLILAMVYLDVHFVNSLPLLEVARVLKPFILKGSKLAQDL
jgi:hypothetical protein